MASEILDNLSVEQRLPAETTEGAVLVTAGAGSGKTRMLTHRIAHIIKDNNVSPYNILAITFTNKAANEMKARLERMLGNVSQMWLCTFHAMCSRILRREIDHLGYTANFSIYTDVERSRVIKRILSSKNTNTTPETIDWHISNAKNHMIVPDDYRQNIFDPHKRDIIVSCMKEYDAELKRCNALDFDDLLNKTYELFTQFPDVLEYYQNKFRYIHVDEFQDTNRVQYELVKLLAGKFGNVCVVGDEDQCIYSWRGAEVSNVNDFIHDFKDVKVFKLEQNYRSTKSILAKANKLIKRNRNRLEKTLWTDNDEGRKVEEFTSYNEAEEAEWVASTIKSLVTHAGYSYNDFAVLMRVNAMSRALEEKFITYNVPYKLYGGYKFFERKEIKDVLSYLRLIHNPQDDDATRRMLAFPKKGIGDKAIETLQETALYAGKSMFDTIMLSLVQGGLQKKFDLVKDLFVDLKQKSEGMPLYEFVEYAIKKVDFKGAIGDKTDEDTNKQLNIDDFLLSVKEFAEANPSATLEEYLQSITLLRDVDTLDEEENNVSLITVHAAKGLEFRVVFIVGLNDGLFPLSRSINSGDENDLEEERRLMYVAITRAKERLYLTRARTRFSFEHKRTEYTTESRFLKEISDRENTGASNNIRYRDISSEPLDDNFTKKAGYASATRANISERQPVTKPTGVSRSDYSLYKKGTIVEHPHFGRGEVIVEVTDFSAGFVTIKFDTVGIKTLSLKYATLTIVK